MPEVFRYRHQLVFSWLVLMQMILTGPRTLKGLARIAPSHIAEWHFRRLLSAGYWSLRILLWWFAEATISIAGEKCPVVKPFEEDLTWNESNDARRAERLIYERDRC